MRRQLAPLAVELERWRDEGRVLPVWWRDDDAIAPTPALDRLTELAASFGAPLHLAIVPEPVTPALAERLRGAPKILALTHGWRHHNHAPAGEKKAEFGAHRPVSDMLEEIDGGRRRIASLFGGQALPVFTPPWNRVAPAVVEGLPAFGFAAISTFLPRKQKFAASGLLQVNTHIDPIDWHAGVKGLLDPAGIATRAAADLAARREGLADKSEPYGLLTHHLVHDEAIWSFTAALLDLFADSGVAQWTSPLGPAQFP